MKKKVTTMKEEIKRLKEEIRKYQLIINACEEMYNQLIVENRRLYQEIRK